MVIEPAPPLAVTIPLAVDEIRRAERIVLACHVDPDGDALGSMQGLAIGLRSLNKRVTALSSDGVPAVYSFLPCSESIESFTDESDFDLAIVLDSGDLARIGETLVPVVHRAKRLIDVDHHATAAPFGDIRVINDKAASTSEIVHELLRRLDVPITPEIATCLFTGVITDTGSFRFQNVTPNTFRVAADLLESGAPPAYISENVFENRTFAATRILGAALSSLEQSNHGQVVWAQITYADFVALQATDEDTEGVVNFVRGVRGAYVGVLFREMSDNTVRISLRARDVVDVSKIAQKFGGGGHRMAAGCTFRGSLAEAQQAILTDVRAALPSI